MPFGSELDLTNYDWEHSIQVGAIGTVQSYADLAPLLDELAKRYNKLSARVSAFEPPAAGFTEIAVSLSWVAETARDHPIPTYLVLRFLDTLLEDGARRIRAEISRITREARSSSHGRRFVPFELRLGPIALLFHRAVDEEQLSSQIQVAREYIAGMPAEELESSIPGPFRSWFYWDVSQNSWKRVQEGEDDSWPKDLWVDDPLPRQR